MWQYGHTPHQALALNYSDVNTLKHKWVIKKHKLQPLFWAFLPRNKPVQIEKNQQHLLASDMNGYTRQAQKLVCQIWWMAS